jgi:hypothetical protein
VSIGEDTNTRVQATTLMMRTLLREMLQIASG